VAHEQQGAVDLAFEEYSKALQINPEYADACFNRGNILLQWGELQAALYDFGKAIELRPDSAAFRINRGIIHTMIGDCDSALDDFNNAIKLNPDFSKAYYNRGSARELKGDVEGALGDYQKAIDLDPNYAVAYLARGGALLIQGKEEQAQRDFDHALRLNPDLQPSLEQRIHQGQITRSVRTTLPPPPPHFDWHSFLMVGVSVLKPEGWHVHQVDTGTAFTGCISRESIQERGRFETGLTVQVIRGVQEGTGMPPQEFSRQLRQKERDNPDNAILLQLDEQETEMMTRLIYRFRNAPSDAEPIIVHRFQIAVPARDELYLFIFESLERLWDADWTIGEQILKNLVLSF
jgi:tetratricopeptide (TPR) repeat protein